MLVWCDIESTSLDERKGHLLEVAFVVTDDKLEERGSTSIVIRPVGMETGAVEMTLVVREMHEKSGLLADVATSSVSCNAAETILTQWLADTFGRVEDLRQIPLAGSTIDFDRRWLRHHMPKLEALFSYRSVNVSTLTELTQRWAPAVYNNRPKKDAGVAHRALEDARQSVAVLRYYRDVGFVGRDEARFSRCGNCGAQIDSRDKCAMCGSPR